MYNKCHTTPSNNMVSQQTDQIMLPYQINLFLISSTLVLQDNVFLFCFVVVFTFLMDFLRRLNAGISLPSWLVYILACLSSFLMPSLYTCFTIAFVQCQSFFQHLFSFFFSLFFFAPSGHSLKEACLCYSQARSYLVALLFPSPSVQFEYPREIWLCLISFCCPVNQFFIFPHQFPVSQDTVTNFDG